MLCSSCGTAYIITDKGNDIYLDGVKKGTEKVEITRNGYPKGLDIDIKKDNKIVNSERLKRGFTSNTAICILFFGIVGALFAWQYPESTYVKGKKKAEESIWSKTPKEKGIWNK